MIYLGIGSSLGDRKATMREAVKLLRQQGCEVLNISRLYETPAWGGAASQPFYNAALAISYGRSAPDLLDLLLSTETNLGRKRDIHWGDRSIDLDLLEFHREVWSHSRLTLPHPEYLKRDFVLKPLSDFASEFIPTGSSRTVGQLLSDMDVSDIRVVSDSSWGE